MTDELRNQLDQQIASYDIYTRIYRDNIKSCVLLKEYPDARIVGTRDLTINSRPIQVFIAMTDEEFDCGLDFQNFGGNAMLVLPRSIYEAMFSNPNLMKTFDLAFADRLDEIPDYKGSGESGMIAFMRMKMREMNNED